MPKESNSLIWCCLKLKMHMRLLTLCLIMHVSHCLAVISAWSPKLFWGALQEVTKAVTDEWHCQAVALYSHLHCIVSLCISIALTSRDWALK